MFLVLACVFYLKNQFLKQGDTDFRDSISTLSDDLLVSVLSLLPLKEAARTTVLSRRWNHLWRFSTGSFNFDATKVIWDLDLEENPMLDKNKERRRYIGWVNQVLDLHQASIIDEFRVCFDLNKHSKKHIDKWIDFAFRKRVKKLELDFTFIEFKDDTDDDDDMDYTFPHKYFSCNPITPESSGLKFLTSLCLNNVRVTYELLKSFLSNCPLLERLHLIKSETLTKLKVSGSSLSLKHLHISYCHKIKRIKVSAPNLVSFECFGQKTRLRLSYAPKLCNVIYGSTYDHRITYGLARISSFFPQLVSLKLFLRNNLDLYDFPKFPELTCLRHLTYEVWTADGRNLLGLTSLIEASPFLQKFKLELELDEGGYKKREVQNVEAYPNQNLKEVEVVGFVGNTSDTEFIIYLLKSAINLEKIVIDPCPLDSKGGPCEFEETDEKQRARKLAHQFMKTQATKGVELVDLDAPTLEKQWEVEKEYDDDLMDRISELPEELLGCILFERSCKNQCSFTEMGTLMAVVHR
ncbi:hypothetical protein REPUB_Repub16aG0151200 [Reevesia pubescens]